MQLSEKLITLRKEKGLSQLALAEKLNVSRQAISRWETGTAYPSTDNLTLLSDLYGVLVDYLIGKEEDRPLEVVVPSEGADELPVDDEAAAEKPRNTGLLNRPIAVKWVIMILLLFVIAVSIFLIIREKKSNEPTHYVMSDLQPVDPREIENYVHGGFSLSW